MWKLFSSILSDIISCLPSLWGVFRPFSSFVTKPSSNSSSLSEVVCETDASFLDGVIKEPVLTGKSDTHVRYLDPGPFDP